MAGDRKATALSDGKVEASVHDIRCDAVLSADGLAVGEGVTLGIRPEHIVVGQGPQRARVNHVERLGEMSYVYLDVKGATAPLLAKTQRDDITINDDVPFSFPAETMHVFRGDGMAQARLGR